MAGGKLLRFCFADAACRSSYLDRVMRAVLKSEAHSRSVSAIVRNFPLNLNPVMSIETHCHADHMSVLLHFIFPLCECVTACCSTAGFLLKQAFPSIKTVCPQLEGTNADVQVFLPLCN